MRSTGEVNAANKLKESRRADLVWDGFDLLSVGGTVTGALLVIFGADLMFLTLPIGFPLISLFVGIRRERQKAKLRKEFDMLLLEDLANQRKALERVEEEIGSVSKEVEALLEGKLTAFEHKLNQIEGTVVSTSGNIHKTATGLRSLPGILKRISEMQQKTVIYAVSTEFRSLFEKWGDAQLQAITQIGTRLNFIEDSISRLESYETIPSSGTYPADSPDPIEVKAEAKEELKNAATSVLSDMKDVITSEIASVLSQLKDNQVDMMQSIRDVRLNAVPQADYSFLTEQLEKLENVVQNLPQKMEDTLKSVQNNNALQDDYSEQFTAVSSVLANLESAVGELKKATVKGQSALEMESLESKWLELRSLMQSLGEKISGVNDRVEQIITSPSLTEDQEPRDSYTVEETSPPEDNLEFEELTNPPIPPMDLVENEPQEDEEEEEEEEEEEDPSWEVVDTAEDIPSDEIIPEMEEYEYSEQEASDEALIQLEPEQKETSKRTNGDVSTVGNVKLGLELLKKGRIELEHDFGESYKYLARALQQFESILEVDLFNVRCLGNCGNTLLALGELKIGMANELQSTADTEKKDDSSTNAVDQLELEAKEFLVLSGRRFKDLLKVNDDDKKAYMNWGKALCMRARLEKDSILKMQLYDAAIVKYEKVLTIDPEFVNAMFFCGVALKESSEIRAGSPMDMRNRISQAIVYFEDVERLAYSSPLQFEAFQMKQQCYQSAQSPTIMY
eukprot:g8920.t1